MGMCYCTSGADPGFQVRGRRENIWGISCEKSRFYAKKILFFPILGGGGRRVRPPLDPPLYMYSILIRVTSCLLV